MQFKAAAIINLVLMVKSVDTFQVYLLIAQKINKDSKLTVFREVSHL